MSCVVAEKILLLAESFLLAQFSDPNIDFFFRVCVCVGVGGWEEGVCGCSFCHHFCRIIFNFFYVYPCGVRGSLSRISSVQVGNELMLDGLPFLLSDEYKE